MADRGAGQTSEALSQTIESLLERLHQGELSPQQATALLLDSLAQLNPPPPPPLGGSPPASDTQPSQRPCDERESVAQLIERLGPPPPDVLQSWSDDLRAMAVEREASSDQPLPPITAAELYVTASGRLCWQGLEAETIATSEHPQSPVSIANLDSLLQSLGGHQSTPSSAAAEKPTVTRKARKRRPHGKKFALIVAALGLSLIWLTKSLPSFMSRDASPMIDPGTSVTAQSTPAQWSSPQVAERRPPHRRTTSNLRNDEHDLSVARTAVAADVPLERITDMPADRIPKIDHFEEIPSFDTLLPLAENLFEPAEPSETIGNSSTDRIAVDAPDPASIAAAPPPAQTQSVITAVQLPSRSDRITATSIAESAHKDLKLEFPTALPLEIVSGQDVWLIEDTTTSEPVASLRSADGVSQFRWLESAAASSAAAALVHGRLSGPQGQRIYLRPTVQADPWQLNFETSEAHPSWQLHHPLLPRTSRLAIEFELPEDVELGWIEPLPPTDVRRGRAIAILRPAEEEQFALGMRIDVRGGQSLTCRIRIAARLDPAWPWQSCATPNLDQFAAWATQRLEAMSAEDVQLATRAESADRQQRRIFSSRRDQLERSADAMRDTLARVNRLQALISQLETTAALHCRVWVPWPDEDQTILTTRQQ